MKTFFLCVLSSIIYGAAIEAATVDLTIEQISFSNATKDAFLNFDDFNLKKYNRTHKVLTGKVKILTDIDDNFWIAAEIYKVQGNEYRKTPFKYPYKEFCKFIAVEKYFWPDIVEHSDFPAQDTCPLAAGTYTVNDHIIDVSQVPPNFDGRYRLRVMLRHLDEFVDELNVWAEIRHYMT